MDWDYLPSCEQILRQLEVESTQRTATTSSSKAPPHQPEGTGSILDLGASSDPRKYDDVPEETEQQQEVRSFSRWG